MIENVVFFGSDLLTLEQVLFSYNVEVLVIERSCVNKDILTACFLRSIEVFSVLTLEELNEFNFESRLAVSCGFGLIFNSAQIRKFSEGIINIHFGKLPDIRGRHPLSWGMLLNSWEISVSYHLVNEEIDQGRLLHSYNVRRSYYDDENDLKCKIISQLGQGLRVAVGNVLSDAFTFLTEGRYYPNLANKYKDIKSYDHSAEFLINLVKAQSIYGGIRINGYRAQEAYIFNESLLEKGMASFDCKCGNKVMVR